MTDYEKQYAKRLAKQAVANTKRYQGIVTNDVMYSLLLGELAQFALVTATEFQDPQKVLNIARLALDIIRGKQ